MISRTDPDVMADRVAEYRELGFRGFQMKVGENPATDVERFRKVAAAMQPGEMMDADAYTGWAQHDAIRVVDAVKSLGCEHDFSVYIEQPCLTYEESFNVR